MMAQKIFHIFRNTPFGRDTLLQSIYFCRQHRNILLHIYIPAHTQFLMYFENNVVTVDLDSSFVSNSETAREHVDTLLKKTEVDYDFFEPKDFTASTLPNLPTDIDFMCCPRSISDMSSKIGLGFIGSRVRAIANNATFPLLIPTPVFKQWTKIAAFFGGSEIGVRAVRLALRLGKRTGLPVTIFTQCEGTPRTHFEKVLEDAGLLSQMNETGVEWTAFERGDLETNLYSVPSDALLVLGTRGQGVVKDLMFGSKAEQIQAILPNPLLLLGPNCRVK
ncbi:MAG: universal stress protein [bacterium]